MLGSQNGPLRSMTDIHFSIFLPEFDVRLVGSGHEFLGFVLVYHNGVWGYICNNARKWGMSEAHVICNGIGYTKAFSDMAYLPYLKDEHFPYVISDLFCSGSEVSLRSCDMSVGDYCDGAPASVICSEDSFTGKYSVMFVFLFVYLLQKMLGEGRALT